MAFSTPPFCQGEQVSQKKVSPLLEAVMPGRTPTVIEGDVGATAGLESTQHLGDGVGGDVGMLAGEAGEEQAGVALRESQERLLPKGHPPSGQR